MDKERLLKALRLLENDLNDNFTLYDGERLEQLISQFQGRILNMRSKDKKIRDKLQTLSVEDLKRVIDEINLNLLSIPEQKYKLIAYMSALIVQEGKETELLQVMNKFNFLRKTYKREVKRIDVSPEEYERVRINWLNHDFPDELTLEMEKMNLSDLRAIVKPWKIKSRSKEDFIDLTINHIKKLKGMS